MILRGFDNDVRKFLHDEMVKKGITMILEDDVVEVEKVNSMCKVTTKKNAVLEPFDCVMYATGRRPKLVGLGLENVGIKLGDEGQILTDAHSRTNVSNIYSVGDCTDKVQLTPVALREGHLLADALFSPKKRIVDYENIASAV